MQRFTNWLVTQITREDESLRNPDVRNRLGMLEGWVSVVLNLALAGIKLLLGIGLQSAGLISDAVHSLGDMATSLVVIISFRAARKPPDAEHPFGHAKAEQVATLIIAVLLVVAGFEVGQETVSRLITEGSGAAGPPLTWGLFLILLGLLASKEVLARFSNALGKIIDSSALKADGWHHRSDALTTGIVILGLGGRNIGLPWLDNAAGIVVALFIIGTGVQLAYQAISPLLGEIPPPEELAEMREIAGRVVGIESVHDIRVQRYGNFYFSTLHLEVSDRMNVHKMHELTVQLETRILKRFPGECVVHVDPIDFNHPLFNRVADLLRDVVIAHPDLVDFHDLSLWSAGNGEQGDVEISVDPDALPHSHEALSYYVVRRIDEKFPGLQLSVRLKVDYSATPLSS
ncbi:MAG: cation diffusion facilitator family transporter [SAR324 cluster bacterium]|nr:cation diffusion facilitator family transporter [SAR324 cluster bacterium]